MWLICLIFGNWFDICVELGVDVWIGGMGDGEWGMGWEWLGGFFGWRVFGVRWWGLFWSCLCGCGG